MSAFWSALLTTALCAVVTLAAFTDPVFVGLVVLLVQYMIAAGPVATTDSGRRIITPMYGPVMAASIAAVAITLFPRILQGAPGLEAGRFSLVSSGVFTGVQMGLVVAFFVAIIAQIRRRDGRENLVRSFAHSLTIAVFAVITVGWIGASLAYPPAGVVAMAAVALAFGVLLWQVPPPEFSHKVLGAIAVGAGLLIPLAAGGATAFLISQQLNVGMDAITVIGVGVMAALFGVIGHDVSGIMCRSIRHAGPRWGFTGALPFALVGPVAFIASQLPGV